MNNMHLKRAMAGLLVAALVVGTLAPAAEAGHRKYKKRYKRSHSVHVVKRAPHYRQHHYVRRHHDHGDGALFGFLGGLFVGAVLSNSRAHVGYTYGDPYCDVRFATIDAYDHHLRRHHHPRVIHVIHIESGEWVDSYRYHHGKWRQWHDDDYYEDWDD